MTQDIKAQYGQVSIGMSRSLGGKTAKFGWYVWPNGINSMEAILAEAIYGPFPNEAEAKGAAEKITFEMVTKP